MIDTCERCDGVGCRGCSGRGWVERVDEPTPTHVILTCSTCDENHPAGHRVRRSTIERDALPQLATNKDGEADGGQVEPMKLCEHHLYIYDGLYGLNSAKAKLDKPTEVDPKDCAWRDSTDCRPYVGSDPSPVEPDERIIITTQYPGHTVKLLRVRYGTLSRALAEAFNGRPWS